MKTIPLCRSSTATQSPPIVINDTATQIASAPHIASVKKQCEAAAAVDFKPPGKKRIAVVLRGEAFRDEGGVGHVSAQHGHVHVCTNKCV